MEYRHCTDGVPCWLSAGTHRAWIRQSLRRILCIFVVAANHQFNLGLRSRLVYCTHMLRARSRLEKARICRDTDGKADAESSCYSSEQFRSRQDCSNAFAMQLAQPNRKILAVDGAVAGCSGCTGCTGCTESMYLYSENTEHAGRTH